MSVIDTLKIEATSHLENLYFFISQTSSKIFQFAGSAIIICSSEQESVYFLYYCTSEGVYRHIVSKFFQKRRKKGGFEIPNLLGISKVSTVPWKSPKKNDSRLLHFPLDNL